MPTDDPTDHEDDLATLGYLVDDDPSEAGGSLTPYDCGMWAEHTLGIHQAGTVVRMAATKGFPLTTDDVISLGPPEEGAPRSFTLSEKAFARAVRWVNDNSPSGYHFGMRAMDLWFMPASWWEDVGGDDLADGDSGLDGDWGLAEI